jgi:hypothetical protein
MVHPSLHDIGIPLKKDGPQTAEYSSHVQYPAHSDRNNFNAEFLELRTYRIQASKRNHGVTISGVVKLGGCETLEHRLGTAGTKIYDDVHY